MNILITNDDGIESPGLAALEAALSADHMVYTVAPDRDRSGYSQSITVGRPVTVHKLGRRRWSLNGTPADCVRFGLGSLVEDPIDAVLSGINLGANLGTDLVFSGTAGAARHAAMLEKPAVAVSSAGYSNPEDARSCAAFIARSLSILLAAIAEARGEAKNQALYINVNVPVRGDGKVSITRPGPMPYQSQITELPGSSGSTRSLLAKALLQTNEAGASEDLRAIESGSISLSAMGIWGVDARLEGCLRSMVDKIRPTSYALS